MIVVRADVPVAPDRREEALDAVSTLVAESRTEAGVLDYRAATDLHDPNVVRFVECYEDEDALDAHEQTDHYRAWLDALPDLLDGGVDALDVTQFVVSEAFDPNENPDAA